MKKVFEIDYKVYSATGSVLKIGKMRVKNADTEIAAKIKLEAYLKKHVPGFGRLVINRCHSENPLDIFGQSNPFYN